MQLILCIVLLIAALIEFSFTPSLPHTSLSSPLSLYSSLSLSLCVCSVRVRLLLFVCISVCVCLLVYFALFCLPGYRLLSILLPPLSLLPLTHSLPRCTFVRLFAAGILHFLFMLKLQFSTIFQWIFHLHKL